MDDKIREALEKGEITVRFDHPIKRMRTLWNAVEGVWIDSAHGVYQTPLIIDHALSLGWDPDDKAEIWAILHTWAYYFGDQDDFEVMNRVRSRAGMAVMGENDPAPEDVPVELDLTCDEAVDWINARIVLRAHREADEEIRRLIEEGELVAWFGHHPEGGDVGVWVEHV